MKRKSKLTCVRLLHTITWFALLLAVMYCLYSAITWNFTILSFGCSVLILIEAVIMYKNKGNCPFQRWAGKYTKDRDPGFDIFLPKWVVKYNTKLFIVLYILVILVTLCQVIVNSF